MVSIEILKAKLPHFESFQKNSDLPVIFTMAHLISVPLSSTSTKPLPCCWVQSDRQLQETASTD